MTDDPFAPLSPPRPQGDRPLAGLTVLLVEDSRLASEAVRLLCLRSGARIRRADTLKAAHRHLATYRPAAVIVDMGLPDGSGVELIRLLTALPQPPAILATSGDDAVETAALAAGANGFLPKPVESLATFQTAILSALPAAQRPRGPRELDDDRVQPDPLALREDLALAADLLAGRGATGPETGRIAYVAMFLGGVGRSSHDLQLTRAAETLRRNLARGGPVEADLSGLSALVQARLSAEAAAI